MPIIFKENNLALLQVENIVFIPTAKLNQNILRNIMKLSGKPKLFYIFTYIMFIL